MIPLLLGLFVVLLLLGGSVLHALLIVGLVAVAVRVLPRLGGPARSWPLLREGRRFRRPFAALLIFGAAGIVAMVVAFQATSATPSTVGTGAPAGSQNSNTHANPAGTGGKTLGASSAPDQTSTPDGLPGPDQSTSPEATPTPDQTKAPHHGHEGKG